MARRHSRKSGSYPGRETNRFAKQSLPRGYKKSTFGLRQFEDLRTFHPMGEQRAPKVFGRHYVRFALKGIPLFEAKRPEGSRYNFRQHSYEPLPWRLGFVEPTRVLVCVRRKIRRQVLHAIGIAGLKGLGKGGVRRTINSSVSC